MVATREQGSSDAPDAPGPAAIVVEDGGRRVRCSAHGDAVIAASSPYGRGEVLRCTQCSARRFLL